ncbi:MAG: helix-turn-helix transcriptional regulator [Chloroflexi bacterium]|nr:helix-turn-helix transcriptional regulator [Chloroflexota bacterium]
MKFKPNVRQLLLNKSAAEGRQIEQKEVAEATGLPQMTISRWMNSDGFLRIEAETASKLAEYFGVSWKDVVNIVEDDSASPETKTYSTSAA